MAGDSDQRILLSDHMPTPHTQRPKDAFILQLAIDAGWPKDEDVLVDFLSVLLAESGGDSRGYLAYIDLGVDRHSPKGQQRWDLIDKFDSVSKNCTLTTYRHEIPKLVPAAKIVRADIGFLQIGKTFPGWRREVLQERWSVAELMNPKTNLAIGHELWKRRGWQPWAAYTTPRGSEADPPYMRHHDRAWMAVRRFLKLS